MAQEPAFGQFKTAHSKTISASAWRLLIEHSQSLQFHRRVQYLWSHRRGAQDRASLAALNFGQTSDTRPAHGQAVQAASMGLSNVPYTLKLAPVSFA